MALIIAGERSGVGKTTITLAILAFLQQKSASVQSFKVGPDYIDPMFHQRITGRPCRNLDPLLTSPEYVQSCFNQHCQGAEYAIIEGVMGLFDGVQNPLYPENSLGDYGSTAHIARLLDLPVVLVLDSSRLSSSIAAIVQGYRSLDPRINVVGVILNRVASDRHLYLLQEALNWIGMPILGTLGRESEITLSDRHLGLIPVDELPHLTQIFDKLAEIAATALDWPQLFPLLAAPVLPVVPSPPLPQFPVRIALAKDRAFNFYYQDNLEQLEALGAELIPWSPLEDPTLPREIQGLYLGGGFPEVFAPALSANKSALASVQKEIALGIPTYAECGGLMYLTEKILDFEEKAWPMVGILPTTTIMGQKLNLGYRRAISGQASCLLDPEQIVWGHEFHRSYLSENSERPLYYLQGLPLSKTSTVTEGWSRKNLHASYLHLHFGQSLTFSSKFLGNCLAFSQKLA